MRSLSSILLFFIATTIIHCSEEPSPKFKPLYFDKKSESTHFEYYYDDGLMASQAQTIEQALEESYDAIVDHLYPGPLPKVKIVIWSSTAQFQEDMGNQFPGAAGYVNGKEEVRLLYTGAPGMLIGCVHEFVHVVTLYISESFGNNPRWLWESVAQYEAGAGVDLKQLPYMVSGDYPTLNTLSTETGTTQRIYQLGYSISEFIVSEWGYEGLHTLIASNGNIQQTFGISQQQFEEQWYVFVEERYLK